MVMLESGQERAQREQDVQAAVAWKGRGDMQKAANQG